MAGIYSVFKNGIMYQCNMYDHEQILKMHNIPILNNIFFNYICFLCLGGSDKPIYI